MKWLAVAAVTLVFLFGAGWWLNGQFNEQQMTCHVVDKDRTTKQDGSSDMRIYTEDCGNLVVADNLFHGVWNSSDLYREIEPGYEYEFTVVGYRIPFFSMFPQIIEVN